MAAPLYHSAQGASFLSSIGEFCAGGMLSLARPQPLTVTALAAAAVPGAIFGADDCRREHEGRLLACRGVRRHLRNANKSTVTAVAATGSHAAEVPPRSGSAPQSSSSPPSLPQPGNDEEIGGGVPPASGGGSGAAGRDRSFLAPGLTDEDLESMFRTSLAGGGDRHSYVVIPASPVFRLRVQRDGGGDGGGSSKYKIQAFFNEVSRIDYE